MQSEDVILKMYFRGEISEAKEEEETSFDVCYKVSPVVIVFTRDLLNLAGIEVELKEAASRRQRQRKGAPPPPLLRADFSGNNRKIAVYFLPCCVLFQRYP